jgi:hypothetical protein
MDPKKTGWILGMSWSDSEKQQMVGSYKHENKATGSIKCVHFLYYSSAVGRGQSNRPDHD